MEILTRTQENSRKNNKQKNEDNHDINEITAMEPTANSMEDTNP